MSKVPQDPTRYYLEKGLLYIRPHVGARFGDRLCVPLSTVEGEETTLRLRFVKDMHNNALTCHLGYQRTLSALNKRVYWPGIKHDVEAVIEACQDCQRFKVGRKRPQGRYTHTQTSLQPGTHHSVDFMTGLPKSVE